MCTVRSPALEACPWHRWECVATTLISSCLSSMSPSGVPHVVKQDDIYEGYLIPKGSTIISNIWHAHISHSLNGANEISLGRGMLHDEELYTDPMRFWPERFDGRFPKIKNPRLFVFGLGRRWVNCPLKASLPSPNGHWLPLCMTVCVLVVIWQSIRYSS